MPYNLTSAVELRQSKFKFRGSSVIDKTPTYTAMNVQLRFLVLATSVALVLGSACNLGLGRRETNDFEMYTLNAKKGPVAEAQNMTLVFSYRVNPIDIVQITFIQMNTPMLVNCITTVLHMPLAEGFEITLKTIEPVLEFSGSATIYGIRRGN